ncbi:MAG: cofactor-independent phosphoglycerate mutase [Oscillospiraceae bacterium]|nr:cofactor-independent phosphoglycerate mutase [Oscillospiraceae bacterium]
MTDTVMAVIVPDGAADHPVAEYGGKTPFEQADTPCLDALARRGVCGLVKTVPEGMFPESDTANLSILGYDPAVYSKGRAPLEAVSMGLEMRPSDTAFRCNLITLTPGGAFGQKVMSDHSAGGIDSADSHQLLAYLHKHLGSEAVRFHGGVSYRHCVLWGDCPPYGGFARPHDILGKPVGEYLPDETEYADLMERAHELLAAHPLNARRREQGLPEANGIWLWSPGGKPLLPSFEQKYGMSGAAVAAVDLIKGIALCAGLEAPAVPGATGDCRTDYAAKGRAAVEAFEGGARFVFVHIEAPDEAGHAGDAEQKTLSLARIDARITRPICEYLDETHADYTVLVLPDHPTPLRLRTHTGDPVPYLLYRKGAETQGPAAYCERAAHEGNGPYIPRGHELLDYALRR